MGMGIMGGLKPVDMKGLGRYGGVVLGAWGRTRVEIR